MEDDDESVGSVDNDGLLKHDQGPEVCYITTCGGERGRVNGWRRYKGTARRCSRQVLPRGEDTSEQVLAKA